MTTDITGTPPRSAPTAATRTAGTPVPAPDPVLPGGIGVSRLRVYDTETPDGLVGGSAHVHLACTEGYAVLAGSGAVQTLDASGYRETPLQPGALVWFGPGTVHRLVNHGRLEILTLMQNGGLPEAGDAVLTLPPEVLDDAERYRAATALPDGGAPGADVGSALRRRDLAIAGFTALRVAVERDGATALEPFYEAAVRLVSPRLPEWRHRFEAGARRMADATDAHLEALAAGHHGHLRDGRLHARPQPDEEGRLGMCGLLDTYRPGLG